MLEISFSPFPERTTERLLLRSISMTDAATLFQIRTMPELFTYFGREPFKTIQESEEHVALLLKNVANNDASNLGDCT
ncbi:MAG: GNAT family protein [Ferruginibacter sp.]